VSDILFNCKLVVTFCITIAVLDPSSACGAHRRPSTGLKRRSLTSRRTWRPAVPAPCRQSSAWLRARRWCAQPAPCHLCNAPESCVAAEYVAICMSLLLHSVLMMHCSHMVPFSVSVCIWSSANPGWHAGGAPGAGGGPGGGAGIGAAGSPQSRASRPRCCPAVRSLWNNVAARPIAVSVCMHLHGLRGPAVTEQGWQ
jgi:hypothetical protein